MLLCVSLLLLLPLLLLLLQERLVSRAGGLLRLMRWVNSQQPDLLDSGVVQQVEALAAADDINPAVQVLP
jgi:hypothetical protein